MTAAPHELARERVRPLRDELRGGGKDESHEQAT